MPTVRGVVEQYIEAQRGRSGHRQIRSKLRKHVLSRPDIADRRADAFTRSAARALARSLLALGLKPKTVKNIMGDLGAAVGQQIDDDILARNPCRRRPNDRDIPPIDHAWRAEARFYLPEVELMLGTDRAPLRTAAYAAGFIGFRSNEIGGARVGNLEWIEPLPRIIVEETWDTEAQVYHPRPKTGVRRAHPIPAGLVPLFQEWVGLHLPALYGRPLRAEDLLFPWLSPEHGLVSWRNDYLNWLFQEDLAQLKLRKRAFRTTRRTFRSLCLEAGVSKEIRDRITHARPSDAASLYDEVSWEATCAEISKLRITYRPSGPVQFRLPLAERKAP